MERLDPRGAAAAALTAVLYGTAYVAIALALRSFTPLGIAVGRGTLGGLLLLAVLLLPAAAHLRPRAMDRAALWRLGVLALLGGPPFIVALNVAVSLAGATVTAFVAGLYAVFGALLGIPLLRERLEPVTLASLVVALIGTLLLGDLRTDARTAAGIGVGLGAAASFGLFLVLSRRWASAYRLSSLTIAVGTQGSTAVLIGLVVLLLGNPLLVGETRPDAAAGLVWLAIGPGALAAVMVVIAARLLPARRVSAFLLLNPPTAALGGWLLLGERLSPLQLLGGALVLVAIAGASGLIAWGRGERRAAAARAASRSAGRPGRAR